MSVFDKYIGLPFRRMGRTRLGLDCWGLVRLVLMENGGPQLPTYDGEDPDGTNIEFHANNFPEIDIKDARAFDVAILMHHMRVGSRWGLVPTHIGIFTAPGRVLHVLEGKQSVVQPIKDLKIHKIVRVI